MIRRYYLIGVVGVGKSTLREQLREQLPVASIYEEWPEAMSREVLCSRESMSQCSAEEIQDWIFSQLATKSRLISADKAELQIIDRSPLDTFAFYPPQEWKMRASHMIDALRMKSATPLAAGELIFLTGSPKAIFERMDTARNYSINAIAQQQSAFEILATYLAEKYGYKMRRIDVRELSSQQIADCALDIIALDDYSPLDVDVVVREIEYA